jgi:predicted permease
MMNEIRHAFRRLRATPMVTLSAIACLSIGVWMTCIVSAVARGFFHPNLGVQTARDLVQIDEPGLFVERNGRPVCCHKGRVSSKSVVDSLAARRLFAAIGFYSTWGTAPLADGESRVLSTVVMSSGMMDVLGVNVALGRRFIPADDSAGAVIISEHVWRTRFGSDPTVIGRRINLWRSTASVPVVGVMPGDFRFPRGRGAPDGYVSAGVADRVPPMVAMLGRLRLGTDLDDVRPIVREVAMRQVAGDREALFEWLRKDNPRYRPADLGNPPVDVRIARYYTEPVSGQMLSFGYLVIACGLAVVLIAAANVVNLLLVRGAARRQEIAVRMALGAERVQIIRGLIVETGILSTVGITFGFLVAFWQWQLIDPNFNGRDNFGNIDVSTLPVALAAGVILMLIVGVWPGVRATSLSLEQVLRDTRRTGLNASPLDNILGRLVAASTAATVMLLVCAVLLGMSARDWVTNNIPSVQNGFVSTLTLDDRQSRSHRAEITIDALRRLRASPGVQIATIGAAPASAAAGPLGVAVDGEPARRLPSASVLDVSDSYFDAMNVRIRQGRKFTPGDTRDSTNAVIVSRSLASALFGAGAAVGRRFRYWSERDSVVADAVVLGISEDVTGGESRLQIFRAFGTLAPARIQIFVTPQMHATLDVATVTKTLRAVPELVSSDVSRPGEQRRDNRRSTTDYMRLGFTMFAIVGIVLAAIGTYGIVAYSVARRTHEIGVRMALGAQQKKVTWMIVEQGLRVTTAGIIFGLMLSYAATRVLSSYLMAVKTDFSIAMASVVVLVLCISIVACWIPGARAGRLNPVDALRSE